MRTHGRGYRLETAGKLTIDSGSFLYWQRLGITAHFKNRAAIHHREHVLEDRSGYGAH